MRKWSPQNGKLEWLNPLPLKRNSQKKEDPPKWYQTTDMRDWNVELTFVVGVEDDGREYNEDGRRTTHFLFHLLPLSVRSNFNTFPNSGTIWALFFLYVALHFVPSPSHQAAPCEWCRSINSCRGLYGIPFLRSSTCRAFGSAFFFFHGGEITLSTHTHTRRHTRARNQ